MAYTNYLLFNNIFLKNLQPSDDEMLSARYLVHESARDWYQNADLSTPNAIAETWVQPLFNQQSLDLVSCDEDEFGWLIVAPWDKQTPLAVCFITPEASALDGFSDENYLPKGQHWMIRAVELARSQETPLRWVVLTNGVQWRLLDAQALRRYEAYLEIDLLGLLNGEDDPLAAYLFYRLFKYEDSFERDEEGAGQLLDRFYDQSVKATEETEKYLKTSVSDNLNTPGGGDGIMAQLCMGIVSAVDPDGNRTFTEEERTAIYRDATYLLYRLLFIFYAEARGLLPMDREDYRSVSLTRLVDEATVLRKNHATMIERGNSLWDQLTTLFNAIHYSDEFMGVPPYNGGLFEDKDKPYLSQCEISNTFLAEALFELAFVPDSKGEEPSKRIDYCDLSVRHLGSLYEGMIEYQLFIAEEALLARRDKKGKVKYLPAASNQQKSNDEVIKPGKVYFAQSSHERKATGTHYTHENLVARLVEQTVGRLLSERWDEFEPNYLKWLGEIEETPEGDIRERLKFRIDSELEKFVQDHVLSLQVCDPAMGSGHFLVYIAHFLTAFILKTLTLTPWENRELNLDFDQWRQKVVEQCLFGVDINGMAVELSKLSLWLATMQLGRPLSFLDHHLKHGNSLLGVSLDEINEVLKSNVFGQDTKKTRVSEQRGQKQFEARSTADSKLSQANILMGQIATRQIKVVEDVEQQEVDHEVIIELLEPYKLIGDLLVSKNMGWKAKDAELRSLSMKFETGSIEDLDKDQQELLENSGKKLKNHRTIHWELDFPQIFLKHIESENIGFDIVIGNPPFLGGKKISSELGSDFKIYLQAVFPPAINNADLSCYFLRKASQIMRTDGYFGFVATNTIAQGDTRETGLATLLKDDFAVIYADRYVKWKGDATVEVVLLAGVKMDDPLVGASIPKFLDGVRVPFISSWLDDLPEAEIHILFRNEKLSFQGDVLRGAGFIVESETARRLLKSNSKNNDCLLPFLNGRDLNYHPSHQPSRYAICFQDWDFEQANQFPELMEIVKREVKPARKKVKQTKDKKNWWLFNSYRKGMREAIEGYSRVLVRALTSEYHMMTFVSKGQIYSHSLGVFAYDDFYHFSLLQSNIHEVWLRRQSSTLETRTRYTPTDCFQTFPFPLNLNYDNKRSAGDIGKKYYEYRRKYLLGVETGLTNTYKNFHDPDVLSEEIIEMRRLHTKMDQSLLACYGWGDIQLEHDHYLNDRMQIRYMPSGPAQREIFIRLLHLNQQMKAEESGE
jgi:hypothetical protein